jgi:hypothetical protein
LNDLSAHWFGLLFFSQDDLGVGTIKYITTEDRANAELASITGGVIGFDTEYMQRRLYGEEAVIDSLHTVVPASRKTMRLAIQYLEANHPDFAIRWDCVGLCLVQIAQGGVVWILDMNQIRGQ